MKCPGSWDQRIDYSSRQGEVILTDQHLIFLPNNRRAYLPKDLLFKLMDIENVEKIQERWGEPSRIRISDLAGCIINIRIIGDVDKLYRLIKHSGQDQNN